MIISCGEALIDMLPRESTQGEPCFAPYPGGAVFNTAIALGRLGSQSSFLSGVSTDLFGTVLTDALTKSQVNSDLTIKSARPTTLAFVQLSNGQAKYAFYDEATAGRMIAVEDLPPIPASAKAMFFGGISLVAEPCGSTYEHLMLSAPADIVTMIDPNIRPGFVQDETAYRARIDRMVAAADIVKLSDEDLVWLRGEGDIDTLANQLLDQGPSLICITRGADGATAYARSGMVTVAAKRVEVVDTVGAGDTFNAGILAGLDQAGLLTKAAVTALTSDDIRAALEMGIAAAAITVSRAGANPPWASEL
jgi:fructokinase